MTPLKSTDIFLMNFEDRNAGDNKRTMKKNLVDGKGRFAIPKKKKRSYKSKNEAKNQSTDDDENGEREFNSGSP